MLFMSLTRIICLISMIVAAIFTNALLAILILLRGDMRTRAINLQIVNLSVTTISRVLIQLVMLLWPTPGYHICRVLMALQGWMGALSHLLMLMLSVDRFLALLFPKKYAKLANNWYSAMMLAGPAIVTFVIDMGIVLGGPEETHFPVDGRCYTRLKKIVMQVLLILQFALPMLIVFVLGVTTIATSAINRKSSTELPEDIPEGRTRALITLGLVNGLYIVMWLPIYVFAMKIYFCTDSDCFDPILAHTEWLCYANPIIMPFLWAIHRDIRGAFKRFCCCLCRRHSANSGGHDIKTLTSPDVTEKNGRLE